MSFAFEPFVIPFCAGVVILYAILVLRYAGWVYRLPKSDKALIRKGILTTATLSAIGEIFREALLHRNIFRTNPLLGYMHMSLAFGWFLLIIAGKIEGTIYLQSFLNMPYEDVFFRRLFPDAHLYGMGAIMDTLLLFILSGVALAVIKRFRSTLFGMKRTTKHTLGDRLALSSLWFIFPLRLLAESFNSAIYGSGSYLTGSLGDLWGFIFGYQGLLTLNSLLWWGYSTALGLFFVALPFSRYMHILGEIPLIFLRKYGLRAGIEPTTYTKIQYMACSRCGICIDTCQLGSSAGVREVQSVYFLRDLRQAKVSPQLAGNCLLCGRCSVACPVGIDLNALRISERHTQQHNNAPLTYDYLKGVDPSVGSSTVGYFAGCMGALTPKVIASMEKIFDQAGVEAWFADRQGGVCCGRPLKLSGNTEGASKMMEANKALFAKHGIRTLVTSCPICLKTFREEYNLQGVRVLHHSEYILELMEAGRLTPPKSERTFTYHDPCELARGLSIYEEPRKVIQRLGQLREPAQNRAQALCCGGSLGNTQLPSEKRQLIAKDVVLELEKTAAQYIVTGCPLCKKTLTSRGSTPVIDISEALFL